MVFALRWRPPSPQPSLHKAISFFLWEYITNGLREDITMIFLLKKPGRQLLWSQIRFRLYDLETARGDADTRGGGRGY